MSTDIPSEMVRGAFGTLRRSLEAMVEAAVAMCAQRSPPAMRRLRLRDRRSVVLRPAEAGDVTGLLQLYAALSDESRYSRYFTAGGLKTRGDARRLAAARDPAEHVVVAVPPSGAEIVAIGQLSGREIALTVRDDYQGVGLGTALLEELLTAARASGLSGVEATVLASNARMLRLLHRRGARLRSIGDGLAQADLPTTEATRQPHTTSPGRTQPRCVNSGGPALRVPVPGP